MTRLPLLASLLALSGCIIYETRAKHCEDPPCDTGGHEDVPRDDDWQPDDPDPTTPAAASDLFFTVAEAEAGQTVLTTLESDDGFALDAITSVQFAGPITVLDLDTRPDEAILVLHVALDTSPGPLSAFVTWGAEGVAIVRTPFTILSPSGGTDSGDTGTETAPDTGVAAPDSADTGTTDTGAKATADSGGSAPDDEAKETDGEEGTGCP